MNKEELIALKEKLSKLSEEEKKQRDLYLRDLALGKIQGPMTGYASIDKPWLKFYPKKAIVSDIPKLKAIDYIYERNHKFPNQIALSYFGKNITYSEFFDKVDMTAAAFKKKGVKKGEIVTMAMATTPEMVYILYGLNKIGAVVNIIDPRLSSKEIVEKINMSSSKIFLGIDMAIDSLLQAEKEICLDNIIVVSPLETAPFLVQIIGKRKEKKYSNKLVMDWETFLSDGKNYNGEIDSKYVENYPALIIYTGGTTGEPKGVVLTNDNLNAMAMTQVVSGYNIEREDSFLNFLPPFSAYSIVNAVHDPLVLGFKTTLVPMFKPEDFPKLMRKYRPNHVLSGPILWDIMINDKLTRKIDLSFLKSPISGGDSLNIETEININNYLEKRGCQYKIQQGYGMTEVSAAACYSMNDCYSLGSVGIPYVKNNILIRDLTTKKELGYNEDGEILISTPTLMKGYFKNEQATSEIIHSDSAGTRWIGTGDIGHVDENGNLYVVGRIKRMIVRAGNKIFPSTVENILIQIPGIEQCSIVEMPDSIEKSAPVAHIVTSDELINHEEQIVNQIEQLIPEKLPEYNIPKKYVFRDRIPITDMSKVNFKELELESLDYMQNEDKIIIIRDKKKTLKK